MSDPEDAAALFARGAWSASAEWEAPPPDSFEIPGVHSLEFAGRGGMGAVYHGVQSSLERPVAVKILPGTNVISRERFIREARILAALEHPHILRVIDFGETTAGILYLVMEWASGGDLSTKITGGTPRNAINWITQITAGLDFAHQAGVIHRDLKPGNLLLDRHGQIKIGDFGLARAVGRGFTTGLTLSGTTFGTVDYMAPEQFAEDGEITRQTDIYALGVLSYQMITGRLPKGSFQPASSLAKVPRAVDAVLHKAMAQEPSHRYATAGNFKQALEDAWKKRSAPRAILALMVCAFAAAALWWFFLRPEPRVEKKDSAPVATEPIATPIPTASPADAIAPPPPPAVVPVETWTNLLSTVQPARDTRSGQWRLTSNGLTSNAERCIVALPAAAAPGENYDIRVRFTRMSGRHSVVVFLPTRSGPATFELDAWERELGGLQDIDGNDMRGLPNTFPALLTNGIAQEVLLEVRADRVRCHWNGRTVEWPISGRRLSINPLWQTNQPALPGVGSWESPTRFQSIEFRSVSE